MRGINKAFEIPGRAPPIEAAKMLLSKCSSNGDPVELKRVLDTGVDPSTPNGIGQTGLHVCCIWGNHECLQILIEAGADLNAQNTLTGATPLHFAADDDTGRGDAKGRRICLQLLLDAGADKDIQDSRGRRPYQNSTDPEVTHDASDAEDDAVEKGASGQVVHVSFDDVLQKNKCFKCWIQQAKHGLCRRQS